MTPFFGVVKLLGSSRVAEYAARSLSGYLVGRFGECKFTFAGYLFRMRISKKSVPSHFQKFQICLYLPNTSDFHFVITLQYIFICYALSASVLVDVFHKSQANWFLECISIASCSCLTTINAIPQDWLTSCL